MKTVLIIGGSKGIGKATAAALIDTHKIINISRTAPEISHQNLLHFNCDVLTSGN